MMPGKGYGFSDNTMLSVILDSAVCEDDLFVYLHLLTAINTNWEHNTLSGSVPMFLIERGCFHGAFQVQWQAACLGLLYTPLH